MYVQTDAADGQIQAQEMSLEETIAAAQREVTERAGEASPGEGADGAHEAGQPRGPNGQFAAKAGEATTGAEAAAPGEGTGAQGGAPVSTDPNAVLGEAAKVPAAVPAALKDKFLTADPELRAWIEGREADTHKQFTRNDEERNLGKAMKDVITPYMPTILAQGGTPVSAIQSLLQTAYVLNTAGPEQKAQLLRQLAQQYNIPVDGLASPPPFVDPALETLQQRLDRLEGQRNAEALASRQREDAATVSEITTFAAQPGREHFEQVKGHMAALLSQGLAKDLTDAYDQAIWARPDLRSTLLASREKEAEQQRAEAAKQRADAAKRASGSVVGGPGATSPAAPQQNRSLEDELRAQIKAAGGRL